MKGSLDIRRFLEDLSRKKIALVILAAFLVFPFVTPSRYYMFLLAEMFIWALLAGSYDLVLGYTGLVSFGQAAFFGIGAYVSAWLLAMNISFVPALFVAMLFGAALGLAMGVFSRRVSGIYYALVTLAFAEVLFSIFTKWVQLSGGETGISVTRPDFLSSEFLVYFALGVSVAVVVTLSILVVHDLVKKEKPVRTRVLYSALIIAFSAALIYFVPSRLYAIMEGSLRESRITVTTMNIYYFLTLIPLVVCYFVMKKIVSSPVGRIFVAVRENEERAKMLGYDVFRYRLISSAISGVFAALAGALYAPYILSINPNSVLGVTITLNVLIYSILGGLGTLIGPMIGAGIITLLANELPSIPYIGQYWMLTLGTFYLLVILFLPYGIVNTWRLKGATTKKRLWRAITTAKAVLRKESS